MNRNENLEKAFKRRYNRVVQISRKVVKGDGFIKAIVEIVSSKKKYILTDYMENGLTKYALVDVDGKRYKFKTYLEAELFVADSIGGEDGDN